MERHQFIRECGAARHNTRLPDRTMPMGNAGRIGGLGSGRLSGSIARTDREETRMAKHAGVPDSPEWARARSANPWNLRMRPHVRLDEGSPAVFRRIYPA
jgi:hypothetical protein